MTLSEKDVLKLIPQLPKNAHKGTMGHVGIICASFGMEGAGALAGISSLRCGAGKVSLFVRQECAAFYSCRRPELMLNVGDFSKESILNFAKGKTTIAFGMGLGRKEREKDTLSHVLNIADVPVVIDADGLYYIKEDMLKKRKNILLTPHLGEAARLFGIDVGSEKEVFFKRAQEFCQNTGVTILLKSEYNFLTNGNESCLTYWGTPAMATAGSGDVLAGICAGCINLLKGDIFSGAMLASYIHGTAGRKAEEKFGTISVTASDISENIFEGFIKAEERNGSDKN